MGEEIHLVEARRLPEEASLQLTWSDGYTATASYDYLAGYCPCAGCQGHGTGQIDFHPPKRLVKEVAIQPVGNYAISIAFLGGCSTGIFRFDYLRDICSPERLASAERRSVTRP